MLLVHERSVVLATEVSDDLTASRFLWVAQEIERFRQLAPDAHTDRGTAAEIPPELQRLAARRSREG
ncbi:MAG: hypothetical protein H6737_21180 [Alphaproteobacteria bacterium]|nr:hypothetical protein [Alphaproteobacteria bacterium]